MVQRTRLDVNLCRQLATFSRETEQPLPTRATAAGSVERLRGIPAIGGRGVAGAMRGTRPDRLYMEGVSYELAVLVRDDYNGASPGSQPEDAYLAKEAEEAEAETIRLLRKAGRIDCGAD